MRDLITGIFTLVLILTVWITIIVGISWLFDYKTNNLYMVWKVCYKSLAISTLFFIFFLAEIKNRTVSLQFKTIIL